MSFPRYPKYKPSGVEWLGDVPEHWGVKPLCALFRRVKRPDQPDEQLLSVYRDLGVVPKASRDDNFNKPSEDLSQYQLVEPGDLVINKMKAWQGSVAVSDFRGIVSPAYFTYVATHRECARYLHYLMRSLPYVDCYQTMSKGIRINQWDLEPEAHRRTPVLLPPLTEQRAIAAFLDRETAKIDALIAEQEKLIELLAEKRQAVISHAVIKGLNPAAPMKPSGVEWLGDVPAHWQVLPLRRCISKIEQGWSPECNGDNAAEGEWGVLKTGCTNHGIFNALENKSFPSHLEPRPDLEVHEGDLLMSRASGSPSLVGSCAIVPRTRPRLMLSDKVFRLHTEDNMSRRFVAWALGSVPLRYQIERSISGADGLANNLPQSSLLGFSLALPPIREQDAIANVLTTLDSSNARLIDGASQAVELLRERRSALISAAVTGQIDVRTAVPETAA